MKTIEVALGVITQKNKYLLQLRNHKNVSGGNNKIGFFGGMIEQDETPLTAICRELAEETSLALIEPDMKLIGTVEETTDYKGEFVHMKAWLFAAEIRGDVVVQCFEGELMWLSYDEAMSRIEEITPGTKLAFKTIVKG